MITATNYGGYTNYDYSGGYGYDTYSGDYGLQVMITATAEMITVTAVDYGYSGDYSGDLTAWTDPNQTWTDS
ncbi:hypothetical protein [Ruminococcus albus]|uniref:hypothetical protein n=1 Tax=Ruminococcus albus TaxID=1264 RepID=UPI0004B027BF|nr:hypothetical protein [Ruminococcus albus]